MVKVLLFFNVFSFEIVIRGENFWLVFFQTMLGPAVRITGGKSIRPADFDKLIHQQEGEVVSL